MTTLANAPSPRRSRRTSAASSSTATTRRTTPHGRSGTGRSSAARPSSRAARGAADVAAAIRFAREHDLPASVRGGGHAVAGHAVLDDGIVIDLSAMTGTRVDPVARTIQAEGGALQSDVDREAQAFGLAATGGFVSHTGVAGLTLGGGIGHLMRKFGLVDRRLARVRRRDGRRGAS